MKCNSYHMFFDTISNKTRMSIIQSLLNSKKSVNDLCKDISEEQSKVSHNLKKLMDCKFLEVIQVGKKRIYSLNKDTIIPILNLVDKHVHKFCSEDCSKVKK